MLRSIITRQHRISKVNAILTVPFVVPASSSSGVRNQQQCVLQVLVLCVDVCVSIGWEESFMWLGLGEVVGA